MLREKQTPLRSNCKAIGVAGRFEEDATAIPRSPPVDRVGRDVGEEELSPVPDRSFCKLKSARNFLNGRVLGHGGGLGVGRRDRTKPHREGEKAQREDPPHPNRREPVAYWPRSETGA